MNTYATSLSRASIFCRLYLSLIALSLPPHICLPVHNIFRSHKRMRGALLPLTATLNSSAHRCRDAIVVLLNKRRLDIDERDNVAHAGDKRRATAITAACERQLLLNEHAGCLTIAVKRLLASLPVASCLAHNLYCIINDQRPVMRAAVTTTP